jgi:uncharacterized SAM-binding protein YcdF (DUF218 family)
MNLSKNDRVRMTQYIDISTAEPAQADLAFVFGTRHPDPARIAADLFVRGVVGHVVLSGGKSRVDGTDEARTHLKILLDRGVPREAILVEDRSNNTYENVVLALPDIAARIGLNGIRSVVAVAKWYHSRRAVMTLKRHFPPGTRYYVASYEPDGFERANWHRREPVVRRVIKEWHAIPRYLEQGYIAEISWQDGFYV